MERVWIKSGRAIVDYIEIHASFSCNLSCESCSHFSNQGHKGHVSLSELNDWISIWKNKITPKKINILGGEPAANPELKEFCSIIASEFPSFEDIQPEIFITSNGFLLKKHEGIQDVLNKNKIKIHLSVHSFEKSYLEKLSEVEKLLNNWGVEYTKKNSVNNWSKRYLGFGKEMMPFQDNNPRSSWEECKGKHCVQLFEGKLWKCAPIAYLKLQKEKYDINSIWNQYLKYTPLESNATLNEIKSFYEKEDEFYCSMCPAYPEYFIKDPFKKNPKSVLTVLN